MIPLDRVAQLAALYDRYNNALDPFSDDCAAAKREFIRQVHDLHQVHASDIEFLDFRTELIRLCREYLRKN